VFIANSTFINNTANTTDGGVMILDCPTGGNYNCTYLITNNTFANNTARVNGGVIKYTFFPPSLINNTFIGNKAIYGNESASFPIKLTVTNSNGGRRLISLMNSASAAKLNLSNTIIYNFDVD
jgi:hypothetical protein